MLGSVGSGSGQAHHQRQGLGLATVLEGDQALDTFDREAAGQRALMAKKQQDLDAARESLLKFNPDRWFKHETTIKNALNEWQTQGAAIAAKNINPYTATDPESIAWRKKQIEISGMAQASKALQAAWTASQGKVSNAKPDEYTAASLRNRTDYYDMPLQDIITNGAVEPPLVQTRPMTNLQEHFAKVMQPINGSLNGNVMTDQDRWKIVKQTLTDPAMADNLSESFASMVAQMDPAQKQDLERRATAAGVSVMEQGAYDLVTRYEVQRKPFNYDTWKKTAIERLDVPYKEWRGTESFSKKVDAPEFQRIAATVAADMFYGDDRALKEYEAVLPRNPGETDGSYQKRAVDHLAETMRKEKATQEMAGQTDRGKEGADLEASRKQWLDYIMSPDPDKYKEAAGYVFNTGDVLGNMTVAGAEVVRPSSADNQLPYPVLRLSLKGDLTLKDVKEQLPDEVGSLINGVQQRGTETQVEIPITTQTENFLLTYHDKAFDQKKKTPFGGAYRETPRPTLRSMMGGQPSAPTTPGVINRPVFKFKK